ncbi:trypsin-like peptidase domain-containing protein [candidate division KSB1 bacterium]|nr:trypsin-like peptidase domain-containing protein [candidate division KSB1 bacterium]
MKKILNLTKSFCLVTIILLFACSQRIYKVAYPTLNDGKYDSEFPYKSCSSELKKITETVRKVFCKVRYKNHIFAYDRKVTRQSLTKRVLQQAEDVVYFHRTVAGTGTVIFNKNLKVAILTCAHIFVKPDTLFTYFESGGFGGKRFIQSIAIKEVQENLVADFPEGGNCEILLIEKVGDIAILSKEFTKPPKFNIPVFNYPFGKARELEWGSFVYLLGFPKGYKIITKGIVSNPDRDRKGSFLIDALFNTGMSGGILLAIRDGVPNFEVVGITTSAAAEYATVLVPERQIHNYDESIPYSGDIFVANKKNINYGITRAISSEAILNLLKKNKNLLRKKGFDFEELWAVHE